MRPWPGRLFKFVFGFDFLDWISTMLAKWNGTILALRSPLAMLICLEVIGDAEGRFIGGLL